MRKPTDESSVGPCAGGGTPERALPPTALTEGAAQQPAGLWAVLARCPLPLALLAMPTLTVFFTSVGFLFDLGVSGWSAALGLCGAAALAYYGGSGWRDGLKRVGWLVLILALCLVIDSCFVLFSWWDAQAYHLPAAKFLLDGWNPVFDATRERLLAVTGASPESFNPYHVAYLPRAGWIWSAVTGSLTGNLESGDSLILLTAVALCMQVWQVTPLLFAQGRWKRFFFSSLVVLSPGVVASVFCGAQDGTLYMLLQMFMLAACAYRKTHQRVWLGYIALVPVLGCNLKFNGAISIALTAVIFTIPIAWAVLRQGAKRKIIRRWIIACAVGFGLAAAVGLSPYLTNWVNHGGPLYPQHSFRADEPLPAMTADFDLLNDDAAAMGYFGRVTNAYLSKWLAHRYYEWKLGRKPFNPVFHLDQVSGLGTGFRIVMVLSLMTLCFTRRCGTPWLLASVLVTSFLLSPRYVGYVRYVPQLWLFPLLVAFNAMTVNIPRSPYVGRALGVIIMTIMASSTYIFAAGKLIYSIGMSEYVMSLVDMMRVEPAPRVYVLSLHDRYREDGRCLAAWETLPPDIPSQHLFDTYYRTMLKECGVRAPDWQTTAEMRDLRASSAPCFYIGEHLWYWPRNPSAVRQSDMHWYAGPPRKAFGADLVTLLPGILADLPHHLVQVTKLRLEQFRVAHRSETP